jgi:hypothetical protein
MTFVAGSTAPGLYLLPSIGDGSLAAVTGNGASPAFYGWGVQAELGTVATSPIPTAAATVTRAADQVKVTSASINYSATAGSWWLDVQFLALPGADVRIIGHASGTTPMYQSTTTAFGLFDTGGGGGSFITVPSTLGLHKVASAFQTADRAITADGLAVATDASGATALLAPGTDLFIGNQSGSLSILGYIRKLRYLPRRPSNAELQTMTT